MPESSPCVASLGCLSIRAPVSSVLPLICHEILDMSLARQFMVVGFSGKTPERLRTHRRVTARTARIPRLTPYESELGQRPTTDQLSLMSSRSQRRLRRLSSLFLTAKRLKDRSIIKYQRNCVLRLRTTAHRTRRTQCGGSMRGRAEKFRLALTRAKGKCTVTFAIGARTMAFINTR